MQGKVMPDEYDERSYCLYDTDASTVYGVSAFFVLLLQQAIVNVATWCLCFGPVLSSRGCAVTAFVLSWCVVRVLNPSITPKRRILSFFLLSLICM
jgi:hypothetical protein